MTKTARQLQARRERYIQSQQNPKPKVYGATTSTPSAIPSNNNNNDNNSQDGLAQYTTEDGKTIININCGRGCNYNPWGFNGYNNPNNYYYSNLSGAPVGCSNFGTCLNGDPRCGNVPVFFDSLGYPSYGFPASSPPNSIPFINYPTCNNVGYLPPYPPVASYNQVLLP